MTITPNAKRFFAITLVAMSVFVVVAMLTMSPADWPFHETASAKGVQNLSGPLGSLSAWVLIELFGSVFAWFVPLVLFVLGVTAIVGWSASVGRLVVKTTAVVLLLNSLFALTSFTTEDSGLRGRLGDDLAAALVAVVGNIGGTIIVVAVILLLVMGSLSRIGGGLTRVGLGRIGAGMADGLRGAFVGLRGWSADRRARRSVQAFEEPVIESPASPRSGAAKRAESFDTRNRGRVESGDDEDIEIITGAPARKRSARKPARPRSTAKKTGKPIEQASLPPLSILDHGDDTGASYTRDKLKSWSTVLEDKLANYGVEGKVTSVHHGPVVTTFEFEPAPGVRIKEIVSRADDLALAMRARSLRLIAPIPGRAAVGIEIPNPESRLVYLYDILSQVTEKQRMDGVMMAIGVDVVGHPFLMNLCEAPHLLIAGTTGSGKSVCLNTILASILFQYRPEDVRLLLVDPKMVELSMYNGIPHLLHPVITDPKEAAKVLEYLVGEMSRRNELFRKHGVRNIESFNQKVAMGRWDDAEEEAPERLPYVVLIIDELGDLALAKGVDIETLLARLAQMARAAGIHMVLATQRPSVDVIVGKTKANFPTRIAFRVATKVDSRTIIDTVGADKLLGKGDMLYTDALNPQPLRLHGAWVSEKNLEELIAHWTSYEYDEANLDLHAARSGSASIDDDVDPLFGDARGVVIRYKQGSTSLLQRKLHIGYARAARLLDQLEQNGIVGPPDGSKPREVYVETMGDLDG